MRKRTSCVLLLSVFIFVLTGCRGIFEVNPEVYVVNEQKDKGREASKKDSGKESGLPVGYFESECHGDFAYEQLSDAEKIWYKDINDMLSSRNDAGVELSEEGFEKGLTEENIDRIYQSVLLDHPEYFFVEGYEYVVYSSKEEVVGITISGTFPLSVQECVKRKAEIDEAVEQLLAQAPMDGSDYDKIKYVYETIIFHTEYDMGAADNQNMYSVFIGHASVCQGYAKATQYLLQNMGIDCALVLGEVNSGEGHSWNLVSAAGEYYYVDTTWGDASYFSDAADMEKVGRPDISYDYLCITTQQLLNTHRITYDWELPICDSGENNYYKIEGCYFTSFNEEQLKREFAEAADSGKKHVTIKCSDADVYREMYEELIDNQQVFDFLTDSHETIAYIENEQQLSLTFWMTNE